MKVGSLVVIKKGVVNPKLIPYIKWHPITDEKTIYTIRALLVGDRGVPGESAVFEEGIIGYNSQGIELRVHCFYLKEVQPPISSEEIAELVEDACCVEKN